MCICVCGTCLRTSLLQHRHYYTFDLNHTLAWTVYSVVVVVVVVAAAVVVAAVVFCC